MEASALRAPSGLTRLPLGVSLLRLRSDEQLVALFRSGSDEAFGVLHDRYRQRLFGYVRQMLSRHSRQDAEDVLQDVFVRAYGALRSDEREINVRAWLYRVAHNRCIDHLRRPRPAASEIFEMSRTPLLDPVDEAQRRDDLKRLVSDVARLPEQQRSALLMREMDGMSYADLAAALDVTVPAVKSLLVRARVGLVEAQESRDADCADIRTDLLASYDRGVKASGRARRHMRECEGCREYRGALKGVRRSFAALTPAGPLALVAKLAGLGGAGGGAAATAGGGGGAVVVGGAATATACKVAAVVCATAITAGGAVEVRNLARDDQPVKQKAAVEAAGKARDGAKAATAAAGAAATPVLQHEIARTHAPASAAPAVATRDRELRAAKEQPISSSYADPVDIPVPVVDVDAPVAIDGHAQGTGGTAAPEETVDPTVGESSTPPVTGEIPADPETPPADDDTIAQPPTAGEPAPPPTGATPLPPAH
ncbi:MAG: sigma-70 family RNA polymerase sigma factor [Solirubrobacteraceae bacterium]